MIQSNNITGVNKISTAGQTIPLAVGVAAVLRILYVGCSHTEPDDDDDVSVTGGGSARPYDPLPLHSIPEMAIHMPEMPPSVVRPIPMNRVPGGYGSGSRPHRAGPALQQSRSRSRSRKRASAPEDSERERSPRILPISLHRFRVMKKRATRKHTALLRQTRWTTRKRR